MERKFEDAWRKAFEEAEVAPSEKTWQAVESTLIEAENRKMKRQVVLYQRLAAASVLFALLLGALGYYSWNTSTTNPLNTATLSKPVLKENILSPTLQPDSSLDKKATEDNALVTRENELRSIANSAQENKDTKAIRTFHPGDFAEKKPGQTFAGKGGENPPAGEKNLQLAGAEGTHVDDVENPTFNLRDSSSSKAIDIKAPALDQPMATTTMESPIKIEKKKEVVHLSNVEAVEKIDKTGGYTEVLWASLNVAAGNYNSGAQSMRFANSVSTNSAYASAAGTSMSTVGTSRSIGLSLGKRVARRWVILSGVNYLNQSLGYNSNTASQGKANLAFSGAQPGSAVTYTNPYPINSVLEFVSVPFQAGYLIVDHNLGLQMNAGVATDLLLRNTLQDPTGQLSSVSQGAGSDSPYRSVNWSGLVSTELSYRLSRQYRVSVMPGIRYLFNPVFKSGSDAHPYVMDIGFRFRYILK